MKTTQHGVSKLFSCLLILIASGLLLAFALVPTIPIHSREVTAAYAKYLNSPSEDTRRAYLETLDRANRPFHTLQYISAASAVALWVLAVRVWRRRRAS